MPTVQQVLRAVLGRSLSRYISLRSRSEVACAIVQEVRLRNDRGECRVLSAE